MENNSNNSDLRRSSDVISFIDILQTIIKQKKIVALTIIASISIATIYSLIADNVYKSEITFIESESLSVSESSSLGSLGGLGVLSGFGLDNKSREEEVALETLFSKKFLYEFIKTNKLIALELGPEDLFDSEDNWKNNNSLIEDIYLQFKDLINLDTNMQTGIHSLSVSWKDSEEGTYLANQLIIDLNEYTRLAAVKKTKQRIEFLQIEQASSNLVNNKVIFSKLIESQLRQNMLANTQEEYSFEVIDPAKTTNYASSPRRLYLIFISLFLGLFIGIFLAILKEYFEQNKI